jgi:twitching motility two-component system response regulator PilG
LPEPPVVREAEEVIGSEAQAVEVEATESVVAAPELLADETQSVQTTVVPPQADERMRFEVGSTPETPVVLVETSEVMAPETGLDTAAGLPPIAAEVAMSTAVAAIEMVPEAPTAPLDEHVDSVPTDVDAELELVPSVAAPQVSEQELATAEWQRWLTGRQGSPSAVQPTMTSGPAIVNEVSERLAHALQRVLGARAGLSLRTTPDNLTPVNTTPNIPAMGNPASDNPPPVLATPERAESATTSEPAPAAATTEAEEPAIAIENAFDDVSSETPPGEPVDDRPSVLVVDDSPTIRRVVADALRPRGYRVYEAADGIQGIREIATIRPDLILMDITMPRLDGYRLCRLVKGHANTRSIPVVMLSGKDGTFDRLRGRLAGCSDYISKPFSNADLLDKVARHLAAKKPVAVR